MKYPLIAAGCLSLLLASACTPLPDPADTPGAAHNSRNSLDWAGTYKGVLPCADCEGIETVVTLNADGTYSSTSRYLGKSSQSFDEHGAFRWDSEGGTISLSGDRPARYRVGENRLTRLELDGSAIAGALADHYVLTKMEQGIAGTDWKLVEMRGRPVTELAREPHLTLNAQDGRITGFAGCNNFTGSYTLDEANARISFGQLAMTRKFCATGMDVEQAFGAVLEQADSYSLNGNGLTLNRARKEPLARFEAAPSR